MLCVCGLSVCFARHLQTGACVVRVVCVCVCVCMLCVSVSVLCVCVHVCVYMCYHI